MARPAIETGGVAGPLNMRSPTGITHAIPRPKSPRRPDHRGNNVSRSGYQAAGSYNRAYNGGRSPHGRRRPHEEMGRFQTGEPSTENFPEPRMCAPITNVSDLLSLNQNASGCVVKSVEHSKDYAKRYGPTAKRNFAVCATKATHVAGVAGDGLADLAMTAAEVYRQECKSDNRGEDAQFFTERSQQGEGNSQNNSLMDTVSGDERRDTNSDSPSRPRSANEPGPFKSPRSMRFPDAIHIMKDPAAEVDISPPRVDRINTKNFEPEKFSEVQQDDDGSLRDRRMELMRLSQLEGLPGAEARLARTLEDLNRQDQVIAGLKRQLQMTQKNLDESLEDLHEARAFAQEKQYKATEIKAQSVQEKKRLEDMYRDESEMNKKLQVNLSELQTEISLLRRTLHMPRNSRNGEKSSLSPSRSVLHDDTAGSSQIISLRAEIVDLRSKLAEAHAANIDDNSSLNTFGEMDELRRKLRNTETELNNLRRKETEMKDLEEKFQKQDDLMNEKISELETGYKEEKAKLEEQLNEAVSSENSARSELIKTKANLQRLERERSRKRLHSSADVDRLSKQLTRAREDVGRLKKQLAESEKLSKEKSIKSGKELDAVKRELAKANQDLQSKNSMTMRSRRKLESDATKSVQKANELEKELKAKNSEIAKQARKIRELESQGGNKRNSLTNNSIAKEQISILEGELRLRKANEASLRAELKLHKSMLDEMKSKPQMRTMNLRRQLEQFKNPSDEKIEADVETSSLRQEVEDLRRKLAAAEAKLQTPEAERVGVRLKAVEQSYLNQICMLKARLSEAESKCREEKFRAEEERRLGRENEAKRSEEIHRLRKEKDAAMDDRSKLNDQIIELRKLIAASGSKGDISISTAKSSQSEGAEIPKNVKRLRNELAVARARLSAARDQSRSIDERSRSFDLRSTSSQQQSFEIIDSASTSSGLPSSPDKSVGSDGSSWVPSSMKSVDRTGSSSKFSSKNMNVREVVTVTPPRSITSKIPRSASSINSSFSTQARSPLREGTPTSVNSKQGVDDLEKQLELSNKRLQQANSRLKGLVGKANPDENTIGDKLFDELFNEEF